MNNVAEKFPDREPATAPRANVPSQTLIRVARIHALAERTTTRLSEERRNPFAGDTGALADLLEDLAQIQSLAAQVLR